MNNKKFLIIVYIILIIGLIGEIGTVMQDIGIIKFNSSYCNLAIIIVSFIGIAAVIYYIIDNYYIDEIKRDKRLKRKDEIDKKIIKINDYKKG